MTLQDKINYSIALLRKCEAMAIEFDPENGFYLAFSGGKDSQVLYHLAKMAGVEFKAHMNLTSIDPPDVIRFVKRNYPDVELIKPKVSIYDMAIKKHVLPTRKIRWCCTKFKEMSGAGTVTLVGIRKEESTRRSKRGEMEISDYKFSGTFDQWSEHREQMVACVNGKDKIIVSPIINWSERDVWLFLNKNNIEHCSLYDEGYKRIGCILCPMASYKQKVRDMQRFPHVAKKWKDTIQKLIDAGFAFRDVLNAQVSFDWWISGKSFKQFFADEFLQQKIDFSTKELNKEDKWTRKKL